MTQSFCPHCETATEVRVVVATEDIIVRGETIAVACDYRKCNTCGGSFDRPDAPDVVAIAFRQYRQRFGLLQAEEIRAFRTANDLTQHELCRLLGWGGATISRYENGALQDDAHDRTLRLLMKPGNLFALLEQHPGALGRDKRRALLDRLRNAAVPGPGLLADLEASLSAREPDETSGFVRLSLSKYFGALLFFCRDEAVPRAKLNKLIWYADFTHFRDHTVSITGARYSLSDHGPVAERQGLLFAYLEGCTGQLVVEEADDGERTWETLRAAASPDLGMFTDQELRTLLAVKERFAADPASRIRTTARRERACRETAPGHPISYRYAQYLQQP